jgi:hypothetical protein
MFGFEYRHKSAEDRKDCSSLLSVYLKGYSDLLCYKLLDKMSTRNSLKKEFSPKRLTRNVVCQEDAILC